MKPDDVQPAGNWPDQAAQLEKLQSPAAFGPSMTMSQLQSEEPMTAAQLRDSLKALCKGQREAPFPIVKTPGVSGSAATRHDSSAGRVAP